MVHTVLKPENFEHYFALPIFGFGMKNDLFQSYGHWWVFQICWHIECSTFIASSFRIWNSSTGIPSPPPALFVVMLPTTLHSTMSGSRWVVIPSWLSGSLRSFLCNYSVYYCHFFLISSVSVRSIQFLTFIVPIFTWNIPLESNVLEEISNSSHSIVSVSLHCLLRRLSYISLLFL